MTARRWIVALRLAADEGHGGHAWAMLHWVLGLQECGHRVDVVEPTTSHGAPAPDAAAQADALLRRHGFEGSYRVVADQDDAALRDLVRRADVLLNVSGVWRDDVARSIPRRVYLDLDPGFTQLWHAQGTDVGLDGHTAFVTVGLDVGDESFVVDDPDRRWEITVPPVLVDRWEVGPVGGSARYTTVGNWRSYGTVHHDGVRYGQKAHSLRALASLPRRTDAPLEIALRIHPDEAEEAEALVRDGWVVTDPAEVAATADSYARYVQGSRGELGVAKEGYIASRSGWVSDRTACYLAGGRPVIVQDTGGARRLPDQDGFLRFRDTDDAVDALADVEQGWERHSKGARHLAETVFAHDVVIGRLSEMVE